MVCVAQGEVSQPCEVRFVSNIIRPGQRTCYVGTTLSGQPKQDCGSYDVDNLMSTTNHVGRNSTRYKTAPVGPDGWVAAQFRQEEPSHKTRSGPVMPQQPIPICG